MGAPLQSKAAVGVLVPACYLSSPTMHIHLGMGNRRIKTVWETCLPVLISASDG